MTAEKAIEELLKIRTFYGMKRDKEKFEAVNIAINAIFGNMWIPCEDRQPSKDGKYLALFESGLIMSLNYCDGWNCYFRKQEGGKIDRENEIKDIKAWKPLPKPKKMVD